MSQNRINKPRIPTEKQIAASRTNGSKSKGPVSKTGKANAAANLVQNARDLSRDLARWLVRNDDCKRDFMHLSRILTEAFLPRNPIEELLVGRLVAAHWRQLRYWIEDRENSVFSHKEQNLAAEMRFDRQFYRCFDRIMQLRNIPDVPQPGPTLIDSFDPGTSNIPEDLTPEAPAAEPEEIALEPKETALASDEITSSPQAKVTLRSIWYREPKIPAKETTQCHSNHPPHPEITHMSAGSQAA